MFILNGVSEMLHGQLRLNYEILRIPIAAVAHCRATGWAARSADLLWNFASGYFLGRMTPSATNSHNQQLNRWLGRLALSVLITSFTGATRRR
jgi:hypothetical protein